MADKSGRKPEGNEENAEVTESTENTEKAEKNTGTGRKKKKDSGSSGIRKIRLIVIAVVAVIVLALILRLIFYIGGISRKHLSDEGLTHAARFKDSIVVHGIDVSEHQDDINWKKVKSSEADFVFIRAGYRSGESGELKEDEDFEENIKKARRAGVMTGAYFFSQALNAEEAEEEAEYLLDLVDPYEIDLPLVIDFELLEGGRLEQAVNAGELPASSMYHDIVLAFCRKVEEKGYESAVYANYDMLTNYMDSTLLDDEALIWAAQYDSSCAVKGNYLFWQCAEDAAVAGVEGPVDHDIWYIEPGKVYETKAKGRKNRVSIGDCKVEFDEKSYTLKNHRAKPKVTVTYEDKKMRRGRHYELSFVKNTAAGTGYAVIRGTGKYKDWIAVPFTIE